MKKTITKPKARPTLDEKTLELAKDSLRRLKRNPILNLSIGDLVANPHNPNVMAPPDYNQLKANIGTFGFLQPLLVTPSPTSEPGHVRWDVLDGHHRLRAAVEAGMTEVPAVLYEGDPTAAPLVGLAMNRIRGEADMVEVAKLFESLAGVLPDADLTASGYSTEEIDNLLEAARASSIDDDEVMAGGTSLPDAREEEVVDRPAVLELTFRSTADMRRARKALRKAAGGKGAPLGDGLLRLLGDEEE